MTLPSGAGEHCPHGDLPPLPAWAKTLQRRIRQRGLDFFILYGPGVRDRHAAGRAPGGARSYEPLIAGFITRPRKRIVPESRSRMAKTNGRSTTMDAGRLVMPTSTDVAAAASVPVSFTSTNALCFTFVMQARPLGSRPVKSVCHGPQNADGMPRAASTLFIVRS